MAQRNDAGTSSLTVDAREAPSQNSGHFVALTCGVLLHLTLSITFSLDIFGCNKKKKVWFYSYSEVYKQCSTAEGIILTISYRARERAL